MSDHGSAASRRRPAIAALVGVSVLAVAGVAYGQAGGMFGYDPSQLPETRGTLKQYTLSPRGDVDGLILADGTEVKTPPHLSAQIVFAVRPGDAVTVRGLKARALPLVSAASVRNDASGLTVVDDGGPREARDRAETIVTGTVVSALHGARGEVNGVLFDTGLTVRLPPPDAARWDEMMQPGRTLSARGVVNATLLGSVMEARAVGATPEGMTYTARPPKGERGPREARGDRDPRRMPDPGSFAQATPPAASPPPPGMVPPPPAPGMAPPPPSPGAAPPTPGTTAPRP